MKQYVRRTALVVPYALAVGLAAGPVESLAQEITLIAGGDIEWSRITKGPGLVWDTEGRRRDDGWLRVPYVVTAERRAQLEDILGRPLETSESHHVRAIHYDLKFASPTEMARHPFRQIAPLLREADIAFANLETPLSDRARHRGAFRTPTAFADGLRWAGIDVVSTANNHALDAEGVGLIDTREALARAGIGAMGTGKNLEDARRPFVIERGGMKVAFLGYAIAVNGGTSGFALPDMAGVVPLDPIIIKEDIQRVRDNVDYVVLSFHWAIENSQDTHPDARAFAHDMIDAGADVIFGHHPHVPRGMEIYKGKAIFYSLGNFVFGHNHDYWMDNYLARLTLAAGGISKIEIIPIAGQGANLSQPYALTGNEARAVLEDIQTRTAALDTRMEITGDLGIVLPMTETHTETGRS